MPAGRKRKGQVTETGRECSKCGEFKTWSEFSPNPRGVGGCSSWCLQCVQVKREETYRQTPELKQRHREKMLAKHYERRQLVLEHYGRRCNRCGETDERELQLDHINEDGKEHRERDILARNLTYWVVKNGFPEGFQMLCGRCNLAKAWEARKGSEEWKAEVAIVRQGVDGLAVREREVLALRYGLQGEPLRWEEVARRVVNRVTHRPGVDMVTVRQVARAALAKLGIQKEIHTRRRVAAA